MPFRCHPCRRSKLLPMNPFAPSESVCTHFFRPDKVALNTVRSKRRDCTQQETRDQKTLATQVASPNEGGRFECARWSQRALAQGPLCFATQNRTHTRRAAANRSRSAHAGGVEGGCRTFAGQARRSTEGRCAAVQPVAKRPRDAATKGCRASSMRHGV
jgi:hypothetical protein